MSSIEAGQVYREAAPRDGRYPTRILVKRLGSTSPGSPNFAEVFVATLTATGREIRLRWTSVSYLHTDPMTWDGRPRRTGYVLEAGQ